MKLSLPALLTSAILVISSEAMPEDFVRDVDGFRHGTHDRIHKPQVVYVDKDGTLLYSIFDDLVAGNYAWLKQILSVFPDERREILELRVYIHPEAQWKDIQKFVSWVANQRIGTLSFRCAELKRDAKAKVKNQEGVAPNRSLPSSLKSTSSVRGAED